MCVLLHHVRLSHYCGVYDPTQCQRLVTAAVIFPL